MLDFLDENSKLSNKTMLFRSFNPVFKGKTMQNWIFEVIF